MGSGCGNMGLFRFPKKPLSLHYAWERSDFSRGLKLSAGSLCTHNLETISLSAEPSSEWLASDTTICRQVRASWSSGYSRRNNLHTSASVRTRLVSHF